MSLALRGAVFGLLALLTGGASPASALPTRGLAQACIDALQAQVDAHHGDASVPVVGEGGAPCRALEQAARDDSAGPIDTGLVQTLPQLSIESLRDYQRSLPVEATGAAAVRRAPDPAALTAILAELPDPAAQPRGFWTRAVEWLRHLLGQDAAVAQERPGWLGRLLAILLSAMPAGVGKALVWTICVAMIALLVTVLVRELRVARSARSARPPRPTPPRGTATVRSITGTAPMPEDPVALLRWVVASLVAGGRLRGDPALTNRELQRQLPPPLSERFGALRERAERCLFGDQTPAAADLAAAREDALLVTAEASPPA